MPILDWNSPTIVGLDVVIDWNAGGVGITAPPLDITYQYLHAQITTTLYHAEGTTGESTPVGVQYNLSDGQGNHVVDESGNQVIVPASENAILMHAKETNTLYHAEG